MTASALPLRKGQKATVALPPLWSTGGVLPRARAAPQPPWLSRVGAGGGAAEPVWARGTESLQTRRWREADSNFGSREDESAVNQHRSGTPAKTAANS